MFLCCKEVIEPSLKLIRMLLFFKIILVFHFLLVILDIFVIEGGFFFLILIQIFCICIGISSKHFCHYLILILICFFNFILIFQIVAEYFQKGFYDSDNPFVFCYYVFLVIFESFCIFLSFLLYKQSKYEYRIRYGYAPQEPEPEEDNEHNNYHHNNNADFVNNNNNHNNNNGGNNRRFVPFRGRGVAVGGN